MTRQDNLVGATLGLLAHARPASAGMAGPGRGASDFEAAGPVLEAALRAAARDPALLPQLSAALGRLGRLSPRD